MVLLLWRQLTKECISSNIYACVCVCVCACRKKNMYICVEYYRIEFTCILLIVHGFFVCSLFNDTSSETHYI
jgi:hypothetical protein